MYKNYMWIVLLCGYGVIFQASETGREIRNQITVPCINGYALVTFYADGSRNIEYYNAVLEAEQALIADVIKLSIQNKYEVDEQ